MIVIVTLKGPFTLTATLPLTLSLTLTPKSRWPLAGETYTLCEPTPSGVPPAQDATLEKRKMGTSPTSRLWMPESGIRVSIKVRVRLGFRLGPRRGLGLRSLSKDDHDIKPTLCARVDGDEEGRDDSLTSPASDAIDVPAAIHPPLLRTLLPRERHRPPRDRYPAPTHTWGTEVATKGSRAGDTDAVQSGVRVAS